MRAYYIENNIKYYLADGDRYHGRYLFEEI